MNGKTGFIKICGRIVSSQRFEPMSNAPAKTSRAWSDLEMQKDFSALSADIASTLYLHQRGVHVAS